VDDFPFTMGEFLNGMSKFIYHARTKNFLQSIDKQIYQIDEQLEIYPEDLKYLRSRTDEKVYQQHTKRLDVLEKQRVRLLSRLSELEKLIKEDIDSTK